MRATVFFLTIPLGNSDNLKTLPSITKSMSQHYDLLETLQLNQPFQISQSTILPLPSSPHCVPMTITLLINNP